MSSEREPAHETTFGRVLAAVAPSCTSARLELHGEAHWRAVLQNGRDLASETGADLDVVEAFAALHDAFVLSEWPDPEHGDRAAEWARAADAAGILGLTPERLSLLERALRGHNHGLTSADPTIGTCWDADRLDLPRVGIEPKASYLSTQAARNRVACGVQQAGDGETRNAYVSTVVTVCGPDGVWIPVAQLALDRVVHVLTAWNPGEHRPGREENEAANLRLAQRLRATGMPVRDALGSSPDGSHQEEGFAVIGLKRADARALGRDFGQAAIFEIRDCRQIVVGCDGDWDLERPLEG